MIGTVILLVGTDDEPICGHLSALGCSGLLFCARIEDHREARLSAHLLEPLHTAQAAAAQAAIVYVACVASKRLEIENVRTHRKSKPATDQAQRTPNPGPAP